MAGLAEVVAPLRALGRTGWMFALLLFLTYGYFVGAPAWNQNSRLALTRAVVEHRTVAIDPYHHTTGDKSFRDGHFYSDKAPGVSLMATVPYGLFHFVRRLTGGELPDVQVRPLDAIDRAARRAPDPERRQAGDRLIYNQAQRIALYCCTISTSVLLGVLAAAAMYLLALRTLGGDLRTAMRVALAYALATPAFVYATAFYGHGPCADLLVIAFAIIVLLPSDRVGRVGPVIAGACLGLAVACEYPAAVAASILLGLAAWRLGPAVVPWFALGGLPPTVALAAYHTLAFGGPLTTGYDFVYLERFAEGMRQLYGFRAPDPEVALALLFGSYRGLFYLSPVLLLATWGLASSAMAGRSRGMLSRSWSLVAIAIVAYYVALNSGYYMWDGGAAFGPRHLVPMIPFLALGLAPAFRRAPFACAVLTFVSVVQMLAGAAAAPEAPLHGNPVWEYAIPRVVGRTPDPDAGPTNLGLLLGLPGALSLVPLVALWAWMWPMVRAPAVDFGDERARRSTSSSGDPAP